MRLQKLLAVYLTMHRYMTYFINILKCDAMVKIREKSYNKSYSYKVLKRKGQVDVYISSTFNLL